MAKASFFSWAIQLVRRIRRQVERAVGPPRVLVDSFPVSASCLSREHAGSWFLEIYVCWRFLRTEVCMEAKHKTLLGRVNLAWLRPLVLSLSIEIFTFSSRIDQPPSAIQDPPFLWYFWISIRLKKKVFRADSVFVFAAMSHVDWIRPMHLKNGLDRWLEEILKDISKFVDSRRHAYDEEIDGTERRIMRLVSAVSVLRC